MAKVSVIVPVYNTERYLQRCIDSLTAQTLADIEIILIDDGSKAPCAEFCDAIAETDPRIRVIHKENGGLGFARNTGIDAAVGEFVGFVDSDDYVEPEMFETLYRAAKTNKADLAVSGLAFVGGNMFAQTGDIERRPVFREETVFEQDGLKTLLLGVVGALPHEPEDSRYGVSVCKNIFRTALIREHNLAFLSEREILSEDTLFVVDFIRHSTCAVGVPGAFYCYCRNGESLSKSYNPKRFEKTLVFLRELEAHISGFVTKDEYKLYLDRLTQGFGRILCSQEIQHARKESLSYPCLRKRLRTICTADPIRAVLRTYPWRKLPLKQAAFAFAMKYRMYLLQTVMVILRDR